MKVISLSLISSIIFSIALASDCSGSGATTCCFSFCIRKTKKSHNTADEPVKVKGKGAYDPDLPDLKFIDEFDPILMEIYKERQTELEEPFTSETDDNIVDKVDGLLGRENESRRKGWYIRPYEEDYEDTIKINFIPLKNNYQYNQMNIHKQDNTPYEVPKAPYNKKYIKKRKLSIIYEEDIDDENDEIYQKHKHLLCTNFEEKIEAEKLMNEAVKHLEYHATSEDGYKLCRNYPNVRLSYYKKKHEGHTNIYKVKLKTYGSDKYNEIINILWDPDRSKFSDIGFVKRKFDRVYNQNIVIMQQRCKFCCLGREEYFYALVKRFQISEDKTIIAMTSANIIDHHPSKKEYKNTIIENANLFTTEVDSEDDIRKGKLKKLFVNIAGYLIEKKNTYVYVTYVESIDGYRTI
ncbi:fam-a protein [Plasmodium chabaudi chabaudi]|uniref:Fam-a protein n=1 Tax=Plasmodium chabaudi chabaudi TaxID=31271 RepID=A0A4V6M8Y3_PLACU|nr:fam-a protein [Plasmodium chabaudi chabaudi]VTZ67333.1 fam-a protein [Plasmodium chabaudi chabaudi]|eukprot:XP_016653358.1 fam-a protein [Plasmodium chabaudi chabaudi]